MLSLSCMQGYAMGRCCVSAAARERLQPVVIVQGERALWWGWENTKSEALATIVEPNLLATSL